MTLIGTIMIPGRAIGQNNVNTMGTRKKISAKKKWREDAGFLAASAIEYRNRLQKEKRRIVVTSYRHHLLDNSAESLAGGACKHFVDGLVDVGVLFDDNEKWCERSYSQVKIGPRDEERTEIEVWEIP